MTDALSTVMREMNASGMRVDLKRRNKHGSYDDADSGDVELLKSKAMLAQTANALQNLSPEERTRWAIMTKDSANSLYTNKQFKEAIERYLETLAASCFDDTDMNNVDSLVVPVLCNLAACCIQLEEWNKAHEFCNQALALRPDTVRALIRRATILLHKCHFLDAKRDLTRAWELGNETDRSKISPLLRKAMEGHRRDCEATIKQKENLKKAFVETKVGTIEKQSDISCSDSVNSALERNDSSLVRKFVQWLASCVLLLISILLRIVKAFFKKAD
jgi:tetratricopeptide (TPR) repeat protein